MSILKNNILTPRLSVHSGVRSTNSRIINWVCAALFAGLILLVGSAKAVTFPYNILINPGAETGGLDGWSQSLTGYKFVVNTNQLVASTTNENLLAHTGKYAFQLFDTTGDQSYIYQDYPAMSNSQWSASCWAICYASNYIPAGGSAVMQVTFYDISNNVLLSPNSLNLDAGTYGSDYFVNPAAVPSDLSSNWIFAPIPAVDATGWMYLTPTNMYNTDPALSGSSDYPWSPISSTLTAPFGTAKVRFELFFNNSATDGGDVYFDDCQLNKLNQTDPDITNPLPASVTCYVGDAPSFTVNAIRPTTRKYEVLQYQWMRNGTNLPIGGSGSISGFTTNASLNFVNVQTNDNGNYNCMVWDVTSNNPTSFTTNSMYTVPVSLFAQALSPYNKANVLGPNYGFELAPTWPRWNIFNGCYFASATNVYGTSTTTVNVFDGAECCLVGANGDRDNGFYQVVGPAVGVTVTPLSVWKAGGYAYVSSSNNFDGGNTARLQIWFKDSNGNTAANSSTYESFKIYGTLYTNSSMQYMCIDTTSPNLSNTLYHVMFPTDQWVPMPVTNIVNDGGIGLENDLPWSTLTNGVFSVPTNGAAINFQVYEYCPVSGDGLGYVGLATDAAYWDDMYLIQVTPVTNVVGKFAPSAGGGTVNLSFNAGAGLVYQILYKTNLTDTTWLVLTNTQAPLSWQTNIHSSGTSYPVSVTDSTTAAARRFYRVQVQ